jgi:hypothetical protein
MSESFQALHNSPLRAKKKIKDEDDDKDEETTDVDDSDDAMEEDEDEDVDGKKKKRDDDEEYQDDNKSKKKTKLSNYEIVARGLLADVAGRTAGNISERKRWKSVINAVDSKYLSTAKSLLKNTELSATEITQACRVNSGTPASVEGDDYRAGMQAASEVLGKVYVPPIFHLEKEYPKIDKNEYNQGAKTAKSLVSLLQHSRSNGNV